MKIISTRMYPEFKYPIEAALELKDFQQMDYYAVDNYKLPIELMMENAGLQLANLIASNNPKSANILIGVGNGNNGGGGLVAARRLKAWGYSVSLDLVTPITKELPALQLERALAFGVLSERNLTPDVWVDAYLGFSQRLPLSENILARVERANKRQVMKISLDLPTGFLGDPTATFFNADKVLTLAAPKKILYQLDDTVEIYVADLGIPIEVYEKFNIPTINFKQANTLKLKR